MNTRDSVIVQILSVIAFGSCAFTLMAGDSPPSRPTFAPPDASAFLVPPMNNMSINDTQPSFQPRKGHEIKFVHPASPMETNVGEQVAKEGINTVVVKSIPLRVTKEQRVLYTQVVFPDNSSFNLHTCWPYSAPMSMEVYPWDEKINRFSSDPLDESVFPRLTPTGGYIAEAIDVTLLRQKSSGWLYQVKLSGIDGLGGLVQHWFPLVLPNQEKVSDILVFDLNYSCEDAIGFNEEKDRGMTELELQQGIYKKIMKAWAENQPHFSENKGNNRGGAAPINERRKIILAAVDITTPHLRAQLPRDIIYVGKRSFLEGHILREPVAKFLKGIDESEAVISEGERELSGEKSRFYQETVSGFVCKDADRDFMREVTEFQVEQNKLPEDQGIRDLFIEPDTIDVDLGVANVGGASLVSLLITPYVELTTSFRRATSHFQVFPDSSGKVAPRLDLVAALSNDSHYFQVIWLDGSNTLGQSHGLRLTPQVLQKPLAIIDGESLIELSKRTRQGDITLSSFDAFAGKLSDHLRSDEVIVVVGGLSDHVQKILRLFSDRMILRIADNDKERIEQFKGIIPRFTGSPEVFTLSQESKMARDLNIDKKHVFCLGEWDAPEQAVGEM